MTLKTIKVKPDTYDKLHDIKSIDKYKSMDELINDLMDRVPINNLSIKEAPAWEWKVGFSGQHDPDETIKVSWEVLRNSKVGDTWDLQGSWDLYEATILFKDKKGVFVRFGEQRYDDPEMIYYTEYYHFI